MEEELPTGEHVVPSADKLGPEQPSEASPPHVRTPAPRNPMHQPPPLHRLTVVTGAGFPEGTGERYAGTQPHGNILSILKQR